MSDLTLGDAYETLFGEGPGVAIVSGPHESIHELMEDSGSVVVAEIGKVRGKSLSIKAGTASLVLPVERLQTAYQTALPNRFR